MNHPIQCRCGTVKGYVVRPGMAVRAVCYCKDCQAFARYLQRADTVLDEHGGTGIVATLPKHAHFTQGVESIACMSLSPKGLLRWYAKCCNTPIANTPRDRKLPYVGLVDACLASSSPSLSDTFGPVRAVLNTQSAKGHVSSSAASNLFAIAVIMKTVLWNRLNGSYRENPFFSITGTPVAKPIQLTKAEREQITDPR
ncbi:MAG: DUF6151 family protein [Povalibacter sp.]|jgi:hypothetical protein